MDCDDDWPCATCGRPSHDVFDWLFCSKLCELAYDTKMAEKVKVVTDLSDRIFEVYKPR